MKQYCSRYRTLTNEKTKDRQVGYNNIKVFCDSHLFFSETANDSARAKREFAEELPDREVGKKEAALATPFPNVPSI